jgi:hypothetical protein
MTEQSPRGRSSADIEGRDWLILAGVLVLSLAVALGSLGIMRMNQEAQAPAAPTAPASR